MIYFLDPFGCAKNQVDAENMMAFLDRAGWTRAENAEDAELLIVNSCGFIESAKRESINAVFAWRKLYPAKKILLAGCLAQRYMEELSDSLPEADALFGTDDPAGIVGAAQKAVSGAGGAARPAASRRGSERPAPPGSLAGDRPLLSPPGSAYVKISEGCDNRCSFCAIPLIRGGLKSRAPDEIVEECKILLARGIKELCLIGQDTGSYGRDRNDSSSGLPGLLEALSRLKGDFRVRLLYIHPDHFPLAVLDILERDARFLPYFDIPFQHASEKILRAMNRRLNAESYLRLIETIRGRFDDAVIRSTFMTGFPGETDEDFSLLLDFQESAKLDWLGCFTYSREENTPSYAMKGRVAKKTAASRKRIIEERQIPITEKRMDRFIGRKFEVLVEEKFEALPQPDDFPPPVPGVPRTDETRARVAPPEEASGGTSLYLGRLPCQAPEVDGAAVIFSSRPLEPGSLVPCRISARAGFDLEARPLG